LYSHSGVKVPGSPDRLHEVKYDGYRLRVERDGDRMRLITRGGYDRSKRYPWIVERSPGSSTSTSLIRDRGHLRSDLTFCS
jgi:ATP-dependent DNA ligase